MEYYSELLNSEKLVKCYEVAPPRIQQFLEAEIQYVLDRIQPGMKVLDLGSGYGRVAVRLAGKAGSVIGIDISGDNIKLAAQKFGKIINLEFLKMDVSALTFEDNIFDLVICIQNGISAFKVPPEKLMGEAVRVTKGGGSVLLSSYSGKIWDARLEWFEIQTAYGLIGEIDYENTGNGEIVCKDGFTATTYTEKDFMELALNLGLNARVFEVDESSVFCEIIV